MSKRQVIALTINGEERELAVAPNRTLLDTLRTEAGLTGTKKGCDVGECGSCTVFINGTPVNSCLMLAMEAEGCEVTTIEGLQPTPEEVHPLQEQFMQCGAAQCGFCTPGILMMADDLLKSNPNPTEEQIRFHIAGNICRCTGYTKIIEAVQKCSLSVRDSAPVRADTTSVRADSTSVRADSTTVRADSTPVRAELVEALGPTPVRAELVEALGGSNMASTSSARTDSGSMASTSSARTDSGSKASTSSARTDSGSKASASSARTVAGGEPQS